MRSIFFALVSFISANIFAAEIDMSKQEKDGIKIQTSRSDMRPWLNFNDAATKTAFNTAVHGQALYFSPDLNITPGYIKAWKWMPKEKKYRFTIDVSKKYHNGKSVESPDFEFVLVKPFITQLANANEKIPLSMIQGVEKLRVGMKYKTGLLEGVKVINKDTIDVYVTTGHTRFLYSLGELLPALAPIEAFNEDLYTFKSIPVGCGSYKVSFVDPNSSMVRVERIFGFKGPRTIEFYSDRTAFENKVDIAMGGGVFHMRKDSNDNPGKYKQIQGILPSSIQILVFNFQSEAVQNDKFREAVAYAFDRNQPFTDYPNKSPTGSIIPVLNYGHEPRVFKFDLNNAKDNFKSLPKSIKDREHILIAHGTPGTEPARYYKEVQNALMGIGMKVNLVLKEETEISKGDKDTTMILFGRGVESNPLMTFAYYLPGASYETIKHDDDYDRLFQKAEQTDSIDERAKYIEALSDIIDKKNIVIPYHQNYPTYYVSSKIKSLGLESSAWSLNADNIELNLD